MTSSCTAMPVSCFKVLWWRWKLISRNDCKDMCCSWHKFWSAFSCSLCVSTWAPHTILCSLISLKVTGFFWCKHLVKAGIKLLLEAEFWWRLPLSALMGQMSHPHKFRWNLTQKECIAGVSSVSYWLHNAVFYKTSISLLLSRGL